MRALKLSKTAKAGRMDGHGQSAMDVIATTTHSDGLGLQCLKRGGNSRREGGKGGLEPRLPGQARGTQGRYGQAIVYLCSAL